MTLSPRIRTNLESVARGGWGRLGKEEQSELVDLHLVVIDTYGSPTISTTGTQALKENT